MRRHIRNAEEIEAERKKEVHVVHEMIGLYCHHYHKTGRNELCPDCQELFAYTCERTMKCPFMRTKTFCNQCKVHCYEPGMRQKIREVMRYAGPRMMLYHPILCLWHMITTAEAKIEMIKIDK